MDRWRRPRRKPNGGQSKKIRMAGVRHVLWGVQAVEVVIVVAFSSGWTAGQTEDPVVHRCGGLVGPVGSYPVTLPPPSL